MDKQSEFLSFPTIHCGKTRVDNHLIDHFLNNVPTSSFYRLIVLITFQHVNRTFNVISILLSLMQADRSLPNRMCRSTNIF